ncbi:MAG: hypothetical protein V4564_10205 [Pseudomonadota bacterium]|uniref:hypothetical protein n=1 Tax=Sphingomonas sp. ERG5 TaxID=1381597 RepID=UPI00126A5627|nr:hypothetical protein [Sphingomonas sp. ERG5]
MMLAALVLMATAVTEPQSGRPGAGLVVDVSEAGAPSIRVWPDSDPDFKQPDPEDSAVFEKVGKAIDSGADSLPSGVFPVKMYLTSYSLGKSGYGKYETKSAVFSDISRSYKGCSYQSSTVLPGDKSTPERTIFASVYKCSGRPSGGDYGFLAITIVDHKVTGIFALPDRPFWVQMSGGSK